MSDLLRQAGWYYQNNNLARLAMNSAARATGAGAVRAAPYLARMGWKISPARAMFRAGSYLASKYMGRRSSYTAANRGVAPAAVRAAATGPLNRIDRYFNNQPVDATTYNILLNGTVPGDLVQNRTGRQINMSSLIMNLILVPQSTATIQTVQIAIVYDKQTNGDPPIWGEVWSMSDNVSPTLNNTAYQFMGRNPSNLDRFDVLFNQQINICSSPTNQGNDQARQIIKKYIKLKSRPTRYNQGVTGTVSDIQTGGLWLILFGDQLAGTAAAYLSGVIQLNFAP